LRSERLLKVYESTPIREYYERIQSSKVAVEKVFDSIREVLRLIKGFLKKTKLILCEVESSRMTEERLHYIEITRIEHPWKISHFVELMHCTEVMDDGEDHLNQLLSQAQDLIEECLGDTMLYLKCRRVR
jgi:hypothetical protein